MCTWWNTNSHNPSFDLIGNNLCQLHVNVHQFIQPQTFKLENNTLRQCRLNVQSSKLCSWYFIHNIWRSSNLSEMSKELQPIVCVVSKHFDCGSHPLFKHFVFLEWTAICDTINSLPFMIQSSTRKINPENLRSGYEASYNQRYNT